MNGGLALYAYWQWGWHRPALTRVRVTDRETGLFFEGVDLIMNLKTTQEVDLEVKPKNRQGGPAAPSSITGAWEAVIADNSFAVVSDPTNPLKAITRGDGQKVVDDKSVGIAKFTGTRKASDGTDQPVDAQIAINMIMPDAATVEVVAGEPREQA